MFLIEMRWREPGWKKNGESKITGEWCEGVLMVFYPETEPTFFEFEKGDVNCPFWDCWKRNWPFPKKIDEKSDVFFLFPFFGPNICCFWGYCRTPNGLSFKNFCVVENPRAHAKLTKTERNTKTDRDIFEVSLLKLIIIVVKKRKKKKMLQRVRVHWYMYINATQWP